MVAEMSGDFISAATEALLVDLLGLGGEFVGDRG